MSFLKRVNITKGENDKHKKISFETILDLADLLIEFFKHLKKRQSPNLDNVIHPEHLEPVVHEFLGDSVGSDECKEKAKQLFDAINAKEAEAEKKVKEQQEEQRKWDLARRGFINR